MESMINEMSDWEKSIAIIKLMPNLRIWGHGADGDDIIVRIGDQWHIALRKPFYLYDRKWMWVVGEVSNWALEYLSAPTHIFQLREMTNSMVPFTADAQRAWLDKVLELAMEAGMVEVPA